MDQLTRCQRLESSEERGYQWAERFDPVRRGDDNDDGNWESAEVLLVLQILIGRQQRVEVGGRQLQQLAVSLADPAHRSDGADVVLGQEPGERPGQRLIEQDAHRQSGDLWRAQAPRLPVHA